LAQAPQLAALPVKSTQLLPHSVSPPAHPDAHLLCEQTMPVAQALPHPPQFLGSEAVATQAPLQLVWPAAQPQTPFTQA
jgi:hypothetical protein